VTFAKLDTWIAALVLGATVAACSDAPPQYSYPDASRVGRGDMYDQPSTIFDGQGVSVFGDSSGGGDGSGGGSGIAVNSFLWRASLDTVSFLPLVSADPFGGVIITDWYVPPETPGERVKVQIYILDRQLRSDGLRVAVFRERLVAGHWVAQPTSERTVETIEDNILARARELRVQANA
jgi:hypothetical protein